MVKKIRRSSANGQEKVEWMNIEEAASHLNKSIRFVRRLISERRIKHYKHGKYIAFKKADLDAWSVQDYREPMR